jgi:hypothetical protein
LATTPETVLVAATAAHAGFQVTVSAVVYPALTRARDFDRAHRAHTRAITPVVVVVYAGLVAACAWAIVDGIQGIGTVLALVGAAVSLATTALVAAPTHGRLAHGRDEMLLRRLSVADLVRTAGALLAVAGALLAAL